jgi:hypothetical protein
MSWCNNRCRWKAHKGWEHLSSGLPYYLTGKYLFFSEDPKLLVHLAEQEVLEHAMPLATIPLKPSGKSYVLCLFDVDNSRLHEVEERFNEDYEEGGHVFYRGWKPSKGVSWRGRTVSDEQYKFLFEVAKRKRPELHGVNSPVVGIPYNHSFDPDKVRKARELASWVSSNAPSLIKEGRIDSFDLGPFEAPREREWEDAHSVWGHGRSQVLDDLDSVIRGNPLNFEIDESDIPF